MFNKKILFLNRSIFSDQMQFVNESKLQDIHDVSKDLFERRNTVSETTDMKFYTSGNISVTAHQIILRSYKNLVV